MVRLILVVLLLLIAPAYARAPAVTDPEFGPWFKSLKNPATGTSCCAEFDGHLFRDRDVRSNGDDYQVRVAGVWRDVPRAAVLDRVDNPTGSWVVFYSNAADSDPTTAPFIYCLIRPAQT